MQFGKTFKQKLFHDAECCGIEPKLDNFLSLFSLHSKKDKRSSLFISSI